MSTSRYEINKQTKQAFIEALTSGDLNLVQAFYNADHRWLMLPLTGMEAKSIHLAVQFNKVEIINYLLQKEKKLLNTFDLFKKTPLMWAADYGNTSVVKLLIDAGAELDHRTLSEDFDDNGKTALDWGRAHNDIVAYILLKKYQLGYEEYVLNEIKTSVQACELLVLEPNLYPILIKHKKFQDLFSKHTHSEEQAIIWYKYRGRRRSSFNVFNTKTLSHARFTREANLGKGSYGHTGLFINPENNKKLAVKAINEDSKDPINMESLKKEAAFMDKINPSNAYGVFRFHYGARVIMPYLGKKTLKQFIEDCVNEIKLAEIILETAVELNRIHKKLSIIHGDVQSNNILHSEEDNKIHFIDMGFACRIKDETTTTFIDYPVNGYAPERFFKEKTQLKPEPNQDIYSLGAMFESILREHPSYSSLMDQFPCIAKFIGEAQSIHPSRRPLLDDLCNDLTQALINQTVKRINLRY